MKNSPIKLSLVISLLLGLLVTLNSKEGRAVSPPQTNSLILYYGFDEGSGSTSADLSGNEYSGVLVNHPDGPTWNSGKVSSSLEFDGVDDYVDAGLIDFATGDFSVSLLVNVDSFNPYGGIFNNRDSAGQDLGFQIRTDAQNRIKALIDVGATSKYVTADLSIDTWYHVIVTVDRDGEMILFVDGDAVDTVDISAYASQSITNNSGVRMGRNESSGYFGGSIDEARVYQQALSNDQARSLFNSYLACGDGIIGSLLQLTFAEGSGTTAQDSSGNNNNGTLMNGPVWTEGQISHALDFDGLDDYVDAGLMDFAAGDFSVSLMVNVDSFNPYGGIFNNRDSAGQDLGFQIRTEAQNRIKALIDVGTTSRYVSANLPADTWVHLVVTADRDGEMILYVDGELVDTVDISAYESLSITNNLGVRIGRNESSRYFDGTIDEVSISLRAISSQEVHNLFFVTDEEIKTIPVVSKPGYLQPFIDPVFKKTVTRITGDPGEPIPIVGGTWGTIERHHYSLDVAWNADMSLLYLEKRNGDHEKLYLDGETYEVLFERNNLRSDDRWHPTEPDLRIYADGNEIGTWNVWTGDVDVIKTFVDYSNLQFGPSKGNPSHDGTLIAVLADDSAGVLVAFAYDLETQTKFPDIDLNEWIDDISVTISPLGNYIIVQGETALSDPRGDSTQVYDLLGNKVGPFWGEYHHPGHYDLAVDDNGDEIAVGVSKAAPDSGRVIKRRLSDGQVTVLTPGGYAGHTSARNIQQKEWAYVTYSVINTANYPPYNNEIVAVKLDGSMTVRRLSHAHRNKNGYYTEAHASVSPDGTKVIFASNWDDLDGPIQAYVIDICCESN